MALRLGAFAAAAATLVSAGELPFAKQKTTEACGNLAFAKATKDMTNAQTAELEEKLDNYKCTFINAIASASEKFNCRLKYLYTGGDEHDFSGFNDFPNVYDECIKLFDLDGNPGLGCLEIAGVANAQAALAWYFDASITETVKKAQFVQCQLMFGKGSTGSPTCSEGLKSKILQNQALNFAQCSTLDKFEHFPGKFFFSDTPMEPISDVAAFQSSCHSNCKLTCVGGVCYSFAAGAPKLAVPRSYPKDSRGFLSDTPVTTCWDTFTEASPEAYTLESAKTHCYFQEADCLGVIGPDDAGLARFYMMKGSAGNCDIQVEAQDVYEQSQQQQRRQSCEQKLYSAGAAALSVVAQGDLASCMDLFPGGPSEGCWGIGTNLNNRQIDEVEEKCGDDSNCVRFLVKHFTQFSPITAEKRQILKQCQAGVVGCIAAKVTNPEACLSGRCTTQGEYKNAFKFSKMTQQEQAQIIGDCKKGNLGAFR